jgi:tRNA-specific 2-thiouridylase
MIKKRISKKVFVGMSGGVDSSVAAALLQRQGYDVTGVFIKVWQADWMPCTWKDERRDAMRVAAKLNIPFLTLDAEEEYKREVVEYMIREYASGRTPNPDVMCNKYVKFGSFLKYAEEHGADFIATGHYAIREDDKYAKSHMKISKDKEKDQTYFLWTLSQQTLKKVLFPIGGYTKTDVRKLAKKFDLPTADKKDSQGLCFIGKVDMKDFLKHYLPEKQGDVLDERGEIIGHHEGTHFYTLGARHGFVITKKSSDDMPFYIVSKNIEANTLTVSHKTHEENQHKTEFILKDVNWISETSLKEEKKLQARFRYRQKLQSCNIEQAGKKEYKVIFDEPQEFVASGQSVVVYEVEKCLGGGIIK